MIGSNELAAEKETMSTMVELTSAFEGIASARIAQIREQVLQSEQYFADLWRIYSQLRVDEFFHFGRGKKEEQAVEKELMILITSEGSFSGDIDQRLVNEAVKKYDPQKTAVLIIGHHGAVQLAQKGIPYVRSFKTPEKDMNINTGPIVAEVQKYRSTVVYYQQYKSLMSQNIQSIRLSKAVMERGVGIKKGQEDIIDESNYIFEPDAYAVVDHLERSMMQITLSEVILESKLAQYASRFRAMSAAKERATDTLGDVSLSYNRAKRHEKDERLKEVLNGLRNITL